MISGRGALSRGKGCTFDLIDLVVALPPSPFATKKAVSRCSGIRSTGRNIRSFFLENLLFLTLLKLRILPCIAEC
jgi:hypothetical protein